jgi:hypothetical protein
MWRLFVPLSYLRISHPEKNLFDWYVPLILTAVVVGPLLFLTNASFFGPGEVIPGLSKLLGKPEWLLHCSLGSSCDVSE